jgi:CspA family cold shock protein
VIDGETGDEVLLNESTLRSFGQSSVSADSFVELNTVQTERGYQAREVLRVVPNEVVATNTFDATELHVVAGDFIAARVKWYDVRKGFGVVNLFGSPEDLFVHVKTLHQGGLEIVAVGEAISVRLTDSFLHWWFVGQLWGNPS